MGRNGDLVQTHTSMSDDDGRDDRDRSRSPLRKRRDWGDRDRGSFTRTGGSPGRSSRHRIYVANIPYDMRWQELKDLFKDKVGDVTYVDLFEDGEGKSTGAGIVEFNEADAADRAIDDMNRYELRGRKIIVREERESDRRRRERMLRDQQGGPPPGGMGPGDDRGLAPLPMGIGGPLGGPGLGGPLGGGSRGGPPPEQGTSGGVPIALLQQIGIEGPVNNQLFVANLDYTVDSKKLVEIFSMAGAVSNADLKTDKDGKSRGYGTVTMDTPIEAVQAISMFNGQLLYERPMSVRMDKEAHHKHDGKPKLPHGLKGVGMGLGSNGQPILGMQLQNLVNQANSAASGLGGLGGSGLAGGLAGSLALSNLSNLSSAAASLGQSTNLTDLALGSTGLSGLSAGLTSGNLSNLSSTLGGLGSLNSTGGLSSLTGLSVPGIGGSGVSSNESGGNRDRGLSRTVPGAPQLGQMSDDTSIFVRHLPFNYTWQDLKDLFVDIGEVKYAAVKMENGKSKGSGTVRFSNADDARRAVNFMNGYRLQGRSLEVYVDRK